MLRACKPQRPTRQDFGPLLNEVPCPACYYSKEEASWKCDDHRHGGSSLLSQMNRPSCTNVTSSFWLLSGSRYGATPHNAAHHVFMTLPAYTSTSEDIVSLPSENSVI